MHYFCKVFSVLYYSSLLCIIYVHNLKSDLISYLAYKLNKLKQKKKKSYINIEKSMGVFFL